jgi:hypothetical protein
MAEALSRLSVNAVVTGDKGAFSPAKLDTE